MKEKKVYYYKNYNDDVVESRNQGYVLPKDYKWIKAYNLFAELIYILGRVFAIIYCRLILNIKFVNRKILKKYKKQGYFLFGNHTQDIGDVFIPADACGTKRIYTIASPSNLGIPIIGKILPMLGILPTTNSVSQTKELLNAVKQRINQKKCVVIYPEAHVWPYYTKIRPFEEASFKFPIDCDALSFCMTTTYYKRKFWNKPGIKIYIDGPFLPDNSLNKKDKQVKLCKEIYDCMNQRSKNSNYAYIKYEEENE